MKGMSVMSFFKDLLTLTPIQHLLEYWWVWLLYAIACFGTLFYTDRKT